MGKRRGAYGLLVVKPEGKRPLARPTYKCEDNVKMDLRELEWGNVVWIHLDQVRGQCWDFVNTGMNL
jgi:hypothetical protein